MRELRSIAKIPSSPRPSIPLTHCPFSPHRPTADDVNAMSQSLDTLLCNKCKNQSEGVCFFFFFFSLTQLHKEHQRSAGICAAYAGYLMAAIKWRAFTALHSHDMNKQTATFPLRPAHQPHLKSLFVPADGKAAFCVFLKSEFCEENIEFWLACEDFKSQKSREAMVSKANSIYEEFIRSEAPKEVKAK